jgi:hypothetical protein
MDTILKRLAIILALCAFNCHAADVVLGRLSDLTWTAGVGANRIGQFFTPLTLGPVAWWKADGNSLDSASTNNGTWSTQEAYVAGINGQAFSFIGTNRVEIGNPSGLMTTNDLALVAWVAPVSFANFRSVFSAGILSGNVSGWGIYYSSTDIAWQSRIFGGAVYDVAVPHGSITNWVHLALVHNGATQYAYTNGVLCGSTDVAKAIPNFPIGIGQRYGNDTVKWGLGFIGAIDDVLFFNRALTQSEITQLYQWRQ